MNDSERAELACRLIRTKTEKEYKYSQSLFNAQWSILVELSKGNYLEERHQWRVR